VAQGVLVPLLLHWAQRRGLGPLWLVVPLMAPLGLLLPLIFVKVFRGGAGPSIAAAYARAGYCGSCGYGLDGAQVADDGCILCPECGAAWRCGA